MSEAGAIILDTHAWIWLMEGSQALSRNALARIRQAEKAQLIGISVISTWEVAMLEGKGRLSFSIDCHDWIQQSLSAPGIKLIDLTPDIAVASTRLPGSFHGDPADRMIVASARSLDATIITADKKILNYAKHGHVRALSS